MFNIILVTAFIAAVHSIDMEQVPDYVEILKKLPFQVRIGFYSDGKKTYSHKCGGSIIAERWVLTVAQCTHINVVLAGSHIEYEHGVWSEHTINKTFPHPFFNDEEWGPSDNNIMLVYVSDPFQSGNSVQSVPLYAQNEESPPQATALVGYWGSIDDLTHQCEYARIINPTNVTVLGINQCYGSSEDPELSNDGQICTEYSEDYDHFCFGDVGAPLIIYSDLSLQNSLAGILSYPIKTNPDVSPNSAMLYTRIAYYRDWITAVSGV